MGWMLILARISHIRHGLRGAVPPWWQPGFCCDMKSHVPGFGQGLYWPAESDSAHGLACMVADPLRRDRKTARNRHTVGARSLWKIPE
jgi:hypothetical protein